MDEDTEYFVEVEQDECSKPSEIDFDYEYDAARFFDFSRSETISEILEAELWFQASGNYPASPLIVKSKCGSGTSLEMKTSGTLSDSSMSQETPESKPKSAPKLSKHRISTLMKPTASHLAKLKHAQKVYSTNICERSLKAVNKSDDQCLQSSSGFDNLATKRQKLETGYLCKVSHLKHQAQMLHKLSKKEFHLKTMERAKIHSPDNLSSHHTANSAVQRTATYPKRPKAPSPMRQEKSERSPQTNSRLSNRKLSYGEHHAVDVCQNTSEETTLNRKFESSNNLRLLQHPPTELFNKMSLVPEIDTAAAIPQPKLRLSGKGMKENAPDPFRHESLKSAGKPNHSGVGRTTSKNVRHPSVNRRLGIC
ncbi:PREDICTED: uncharacterized protein LOC109151231 isoform X2 [Ipomoea nil]|uniref:uncharacterized protein LOC109151231 isoform X2 n=1 Tax=Ipomoea nil TaxID=35883 RepID=UPI000900DD26|nr:PREDICTED: uncharacterized protein LOC109151231 isoform X2 [Ipomoea nil]